MNDAVKDPEILEALYWHEGLSMWQIAERLECSKTTVYQYMTKFGIDRRCPNKAQAAPPTAVPYRTHKRGYPAWDGKSDKDGFSTIYVHQLLAIAEGADPHKVFSGGDYAVHHKNGVKFDNRPDNLELLSEFEHQKLHHERGDMHNVGTWQRYSEDELLEWLHSFVAEFGYVPRYTHIEGWPGPSGETYRRRFGSWPAALEAAGLKESARAGGEA